MPSPSLTPSHARLGVRLLALYFVVDGLWQLLSNLLSSIQEFDPNYLGFYVRTQALSPLLGIALGFSLFFLSGWIGRRWIGSGGE